MVEKRRRPWYNQRREWENELAKIRTEENLTIKELCEKAKIPQSLFSGLQSGMISPLYLSGHREGKVKPWASKILKVLECTFEDVFPRYVCDIAKNELSDDQVLDITMSELSMNGDLFQCLCKKRLFDKLRWVVGFLLPRESEVIRCRFWHGWSLDEVATWMKISGERVRQLETRALRKMRHPTISRKLKDYHA